MNRPLALLGPAILAFGTAHAQTVPGSWSSTWSADYSVGDSDLAGYSYDLGNNGGWGNNEREVYTDSRANSHVSGGALHIAAIASGTGANQTYTSARLLTPNLFSQTGGLFEFRAKMPVGTGLWPALWMMPRDSAYGGWPTSGEIDVFESRGDRPTQVQGSVHSGASVSDHRTQTGLYNAPAGFTTADWHTYGLAWSAGSLKWYVDGNLYETQNGGWYSPLAGNPNAPFDKPFYIIMNLAVGGDYVGGTVNLSPGTYEMQIDYVHAYQAVPEPTSLAALAGACLVFSARRRKRA